MPPMSRRAICLFLRPSHLTIDDAKSFLVVLPTQAHQSERGYFGRRLQYLDCASNLVVPTDDRIQLTVGLLCCRVNRESFQRGDYPCTRLFHLFHPLMGIDGFESLSQKPLHSFEHGSWALRLKPRNN